MRLDKGDFIGRSAVLAARQAGVRKRLAIFLVADPKAWAWGGEGILRDGVPVGEVTSAGWSATHGRAVVMGYVQSGEPVTERDWVLSGHYTLDIAGATIPMQVLARPPFRS